MANTDPRAPEAYGPNGNHAAGSTWVDVDVREPAVTPKEGGTMPLDVKLCHEAAHMWRFLTGNGLGDADRNAEELSASKTENDYRERTGRPMRQEYNGKSVPGWQTAAQRQASGQPPPPCNLQRNRTPNFIRP